MRSKPKLAQSRKPAAPVEPAPVVARNEKLQAPEIGSRKLNFIVKKYQREGADAAIESINMLLRDGYDPSEHSAVVTASVSVVDGWIERGDAFSGRKASAFAPETCYLERLMDHLPHEDTRGLWSALFIVAQNPESSKNPTPGQCPFTVGHQRGHPAILKRGRVYPYGSFRNALSRIRTRKARK